MEAGGHGQSLRRPHPFALSRREDGARLPQRRALQERHLLSLRWSRPPPTRNLVERKVQTRLVLLLREPYDLPARGGPGPPCAPRPLLLGVWPGSSVLHLVSTDTLVDPRVTLPSLKRTKMRLLPGSKGTVPPPVTKTATDGWAPAGMVVVTVGPAGCRHTPAVLVWQSDTVIGSATVPVSAETVMVPDAPTFTVATAKKPVPVGPGIFTRPSLSTVAARATMSGTGMAAAENNSVFNPTMIGACAPAHAKLNCTSVGPNGNVGVTAMTKGWKAPAVMLTGVPFNPTSWLVAGLVVWKLKVAPGTLVIGEI